MINGDKRKFMLNPDVKLYALIDAGFQKTPRGNFVYEHPLYNESPYNATTKLKMTIKSDLTSLTMVVTNNTTRFNKRMLPIFHIKNRLVCW